MGEQRRVGEEVGDPGGDGDPSRDCDLLDVTVQVGAQSGRQSVVGLPPLPVADAGLPLFAQVAAGEGVDLLEEGGVRDGASR